MPSKSHGHSSGHPGRQTSTYSIWQAMISRCCNPKGKNWHNYGGRGIAVCERWHKFENFLSDMGERPAGLSLDRIDNDGNYEPVNCRWATQKEQVRNSRTTIMVTVNGETRTLGEWAALIGSNAETLYFRMYRGWTAERAVTTPPKWRRK